MIQCTRFFCIFAKLFRQTNENMLHPRTLLPLLLCICLASQLSAQKKPKKELFVPMDYSACGYHASEQAIPNVPVTVYVAWEEGDCSPLIQQAIDEAGEIRHSLNRGRNKESVIWVVLSVIRISLLRIFLRTFAA